MDECMDGSASSATRASLPPSRPTRSAAPNSERRRKKREADRMAQRANRERTRGHSRSATVCCTTPASRYSRISSLRSWKSSRRSLT
ncbi:hypothetical protein DH86_00002121, partial [Scytalidium sp. 3C]